MAQDPLIIFVCEHGAAKSIIAAAYFNKYARERNLRFYAVARGTQLDSELSPSTVAGLHEDGLSPNESVPQKLSAADIESAQQIVSFCLLPEEYQKKFAIELWDDIPPVSENYEKARDTILAKLKALMK
jgi:arsenate reductase (thioredoxin)